MDHTVRVGALRGDVTVLAAPAALAPLRARLNRALTELLPPLLAEASGPLLDRHHGVLRVRCLQVDLDAATLDGAALARLLAQLIAAALSEALSTVGANVAAWADHDAYLTAYVETRLGLEPGPMWPFTERALEVLSPTEAAVELLRVRPGLLARLARNGAAGGNPARLSARLDDPACAAMLDAVIDGTSAPAAADVAALSGSLPATPPPPEGVPRAVLEVSLRELARAPHANAPRLVRAAAATTALAALPRPWRDALTVPGSYPGNDADRLAVDLAREVPSLTPALRAGLLAAVAEPPVRTALAALVGPPAARPTRPRREDDTRGDRPAHRRPAAPRRSTPARRELASPVAGVALLLPGAARHAWELTGIQLREAVLSTLGVEARRGARTDPLLATLLPADPHARLGEVPLVPEQLLDALPPASRPLVAAPGGAGRWGEFLVADFAARLPGLSRSSMAYLRRQFLQVPGRLEIDPAELIVTLLGPALAVVLAMGGFKGDQGPLPHLEDRHLTIVLTGMRR